MARKVRQMALGISPLAQNRPLSHGIWDQTPHHGLLENKQRRVILQVNPPHFNFKHFQGELPIASSVIFNTNYHWSGIPIGLLISEGKQLVSFSVKPERPIFFRTKSGEIGMTKDRTNQEEWRTAFQAGPTLIWNNLVVYPGSRTDESFKDDITRKTRHLGIGITQVGKILLIGIKNGTLEELTSAFESYEVPNAMNLDGGSSCRLTYIVTGRVHISFFGTESTTVGMALSEIR